MNYASIQISFIALIPSLLLCYYIYQKDRVEKEPIGLLTFLFAVGAIVYIPSLFAESYVIGKIDAMFSESIQFSLGGVANFSSTGKQIAHHGLCAFVGTAFIEETLKWLCLFLITRKSKHFNCLFDGIVYSTFLSMGFAAVENIRYAWIDGWDTLLLRAITSVPGHLCFGIVMGIGYTIWHANGKSWLWLLLSYLLPVLVHGTYSFTGAYGTRSMNIVFYIFIFVLYALCFAGVHVMSKQDSVVVPEPEETKEEEVQGGTQDE